MAKKATSLTDARVAELEHARQVLTTALSRAAQRLDDGEDITVTAAITDEVRRLHGEDSS